jgi:hypothetical protein
MLHSIVTTYHDIPSCGQIAFSHNPATGEIAIDFERFDASDGVVLPQYHLDVTTEHAAAWAGSVLQVRCGRRSKVITGKHDSRRFATALRLTAADSNLVYYTHSAQGVVVLRGGRVLKVPLRMGDGMGQFEGMMGEIAMEERQDVTVAEEFAEYVVAMMG